MSTDRPSGTAHSSTWIACAVDPLAFRVFFPPQFAFAAGEPDDGFPLGALLSLPHADSSTAPMARKHSAAPDRLRLKTTPSNGRVRAASRPTTVSTCSCTAATPPVNVSRWVAGVRGFVGCPALNQTLDLIGWNRFTGRVSTEHGAPQWGKKSQMKVTVDQDTCASSGNCVMHAPAVFDQRDEDGVVVLLVGEPPAEHGEATLKAAASCPAQAIHVEE